MCGHWNDYGEHVVGIDLTRPKWRMLALNSLGHKFIITTDLKYVFLMALCAAIARWLVPDAGAEVKISIIFAYAVFTIFYTATYAKSFLQSLLQIPRT